MSKSDDGKVVYTGPIHDKLGQPIIPGCLIAYGHALGRCAALRLGKVIKIGCVITPEFHNQFVSYPERREYRITVHGIDDDNIDTNEPDKTDYSGSKELPKLLGKKSTLQFPSRVIVLDRKLVPQIFLDLFDTIAV